MKLGARSAPHGVIVGPDGAPWITDSGLNAIVRVDPDTRAVKVWPLPTELQGNGEKTEGGGRRGPIVGLRAIWWVFLRYSRQAGSLPIRPHG